MGLGSGVYISTIVRDHGGHVMASLSEKQLCFGHQNAAKLALAVL